MAANYTFGSGDPDEQEITRSLDEPTEAPSEPSVPAPTGKSTTTTEPSLPGGATEDDAFTIGKTVEDTTKLSDGSTFVRYSDGSYRIINPQTNAVRDLTAKEAEDQAKADKEVWMRKEAEPGFLAKLAANVLGFLGGAAVSAAAGVAGTAAGGPGAGLAAAGIAGTTTGAAIRDKVLQGMTPTREELIKLRDELLAKAGGDPMKESMILRGLETGDPEAIAQGVSPPAPSADKEPTPTTGKTQTSGVPMPSTTTPSVTAQPPQSAPSGIGGSAGGQLAANAGDLAERARFEALVKSYNPQANMQQFAPTVIKEPDNPYLTQMGQKMSEQTAGIAQSEAFAAQERARLAGLSKYTPETRDVWKQYFTPEQYKAQASLANAVQAGMTTVAPAQLAQGEYQANLAQMQGFDPTFARSDLRGAAVETQQMMMDRAKGLKPSVAEESYKANLDRLIASQGAAAGAIRGQDQALAQRNLAGMATQQGQQAVRETAILRMQEQQAAEQAAAAQANAVMIQDEKVASEQKVNELNRNIQILNADLQNQKNLLERDTFNAEAMNRANQLQAQLDSQVRQLNAQMENQVNLQNAELQTKTSLQNALQALEASKFAGTMAQSSLAAQMAQERTDWASAYDVGRQPIADRAKVVGEQVATLSQIGWAKEGYAVQLKQLADAAAVRAETLRRQDKLAEAQEAQSQANAYMNLYNSIVKSGSSTPAPTFSPLFP